eukprot:5785502-Amphidinium_carterae.1
MASCRTRFPLQAFKNLQAQSDAGIVNWLVERADGLCKLLGFCWRPCFQSSYHLRMTYIRSEGRSRNRLCGMRSGANEDGGRPGGTLVQ